MELPQQLCSEMLIPWLPLVAFNTTGGGDNLLLGSVGASPWYIWWNKVSVPTCLLCASG